MVKSLRRILVIYKGYRLRLVISQVLLMASALCTIGVATLNQRLINEGLIAEEPVVIIQTGIWMAVLAVIGGAAMAVFLLLLRQVCETVLCQTEVVGNTEKNTVFFFSSSPPPPPS